MSASMFLFAFAASAWGGLSHIPGAFGDVAPSAGALGLGGAYVVSAHGPEALSWNPAGLVGGGREVCISNAKRFRLVPQSSLLYGDEVLGHPVAVGFRTVGDAALRENTLSLGTAGVLPWNIASGVVLKLYHASFGGNSDGSWVVGGAERQVRGKAYGFGLDVGFGWTLGGRISCGVVLKDLLSRVWYDASNGAGTAGGGGEGVPLRVAFGLAFTSGGTLFEVDLRKAIYADQVDRVYLGVERPFLGMLKLRGGMAQNLEAEQDRSLSAGFGMDFNLGPVPMGVDLAYTSAEIGDSFAFSVRWVRPGSGGDRGR